MSPVVIKPGSSKQAVSALGAGNERKDTFSLARAFRNWLQILFTPGEFFAGEEGATGFQGPFAMLCAYVFVFGSAIALMLLITDVTSNRLSSFAPTAAFAPAAVRVGFYGILMALWSLLLHGVSRLCGGKGEYSGTYRATVYAFVPYATLVPFASVFTLAQHPLGSLTVLYSDPILMAANVASYVWTIPLQVMGLRATQNMSQGGAIVATLVSAITMAVIVAALYAVMALSPLLTAH